MVAEPSELTLKRAFGVGESDSQLTEASRPQRGQSWMNHPGTPLTWELPAPSLRPFKKKKMMMKQWNLGIRNLLALDRPRLSRILELIVSWSPATNQPQIGEQPASRSDDPESRQMKMDELHLAHLLSAKGTARCTAPGERDGQRRAQSLKIDQHSVTKGLAGRLKRNLHGPRRVRMRARRALRASCISYVFGVSKIF